MARRNRQSDDNIQGNTEDAGQDHSEAGSNAAGQSGGTEGAESGNSSITNDISGNKNGAIRMEGEGAGEAQATSGEQSAIDPALAAGPEQPKKRRARGPNRAKTSARLDVTPAELAKQLQGVHFMVAMISGVPVWQLQEAEAQMLAKALLNVGEQYNINLLGGKSFAFVQLVAVCGMIYIPRVYTIQQAKRQQQMEAQRPENVDPHLNSSPDGTTGEQPRGQFDYSGLN